MTCIIGVVDDNGTVWMGADTIAVDSEGVGHHRKDTKIAIIQRRFVVGGSGSPRMNQLVHYALELPSASGVRVDHRWMVLNFIPALVSVMKDHDAEDEDGDLDGGLLVGVDGHLFEIQCDYQVAEHEEDYWSIGSGREVALGALTSNLGVLPADRRIQYAMGAAAKHMVTVGGGITLLSVERGVMW
jgi:ATP-dependent protease HslVU (ClpYQ) peptidase subunit